MNVPQAGPLRILLICPDAVLREGLGNVFAELGTEAVLSHAMAAYPSGGDLARALRTFSPQAVFLSFEQAETAVAVMRFLESEADGLPVVGLHTVANPALLLQAMHLGAREFLAPPFAAGQVSEMLQVMRSLLKKAPLSYSATEHIYSFLPAKPGVGTSTVAMNVSAALAQEPGMKVLLSDLDLTCGMLRFLLKLPQDLSIVDALVRATDMDVSLWPQLVTRREGFDVLHSGSINPHAYLDPSQIQGLVDFARSTYNALFFDMSGNMERHSIHVMQESRQVFLVCNPEPASLFLAKEKIEFMRTLGLGERTSVILNRADQALAVPANKIKSILGVPVAAQFSDDSFWVNVAIGSARTLVGDGKGKNSKLAREFRAFARALVSASTRTVQGAVEHAPATGMLAVAS